MAETKMQLVDWLDDLCVRFIINLPHEELASVERICFQIEEAQWFYEDFVRPTDPSLPSLNLRDFSLAIFRHCPLFAGFSLEHHLLAFSEFLAYKTRVPVRGAILLNDAMDHVLLVKGWKKNASWSFPRGKINKDEKDLDCAIREVYEETGFDVASSPLEVNENVKFIEVTMREQHMRLYVFRGVPIDTPFQPRTRKEISKIQWWKLASLPGYQKRKQKQSGDEEGKANKFYMVAPFLSPLNKWISQQHRLANGRAASAAYDSSYSAAEEGFTDGDGVGKRESYHSRQVPLQSLSVSSVSNPSNTAASLHSTYNLPVQPSDDSSAELKRLLSVPPGNATSHPSFPPNESIQPTNASLLSLFQERSVHDSRRYDSQNMYYKQPSQHMIDGVHYQLPTQAFPFGAQTAFHNPQNQLHHYRSASSNAPEINPPRAGGVAPVLGNAPFRGGPHHLLNLFQQAQLPQSDFQHSSSTPFVGQSLEPTNTLRQSIQHPQHQPRSYESAEQSLPDTSSMRLRENVTARPTGRGLDNTKRQDVYHGFDQGPGTTRFEVGQRAKQNSKDTSGTPAISNLPQATGADVSRVPPASALPQPRLNEHTLRLLNAFKSGSVGKDDASPQIAQTNEVSSAPKDTPSMAVKSTSVEPLLRGSPNRGFRGLVPSVLSPVQGGIAKAPVSPEPRFQMRTNQDPLVQPKHPALPVDGTASPKLNARAAKERLSSAEPSLTASDEVMAVSLKSGQSAFDSQRNSKKRAPMHDSEEKIRTDSNPATSTFTPRILQRPQSAGKSTVAVPSTLAGEKVTHPEPRKEHPQQPISVPQPAVKSNDRSSGKGKTRPAKNENLVKEKHSRSPATPVQILKRPVEAQSGNSKPAPAPFQPQILQRPRLVDSNPSSSPPRGGANEDASTDQRISDGTREKLLALFAGQFSNTEDKASLPLFQKSTTMTTSSAKTQENGFAQKSGVSHVALSNTTLPGRSRLSSDTSGHQEMGSGRSRRDSASQTPLSPEDKGSLLSYLDNVVRNAQR